MDAVGSAGDRWTESRRGWENLLKATALRGGEHSDSTLWLPPAELDCLSGQAEIFSPDGSVPRRKAQLTEVTSLWLGGTRLTHACGRSVCPRLPDTQRRHTLPVEAAHSRRERRVDGLDSQRGLGSGNPEERSAQLRRERPVWAGDRVTA